jgi:hypothetical protein
MVTFPEYEKGLEESDKVIDVCARVRVGVCIGRVCPWIECTSDSFDYHLSSCFSLFLYLLTDTTHIPSHTHTHTHRRYKDTNSKAKGMERETRRTDEVRRAREEEEGEEE